jgi:hypothetical protein
LLKSAQKLAETPHFYAAAAELAAARKNFRGTKERLRQALLADPALAPHLLPGLIAAEEGIGEGMDGGAKPKEDELAEEDAPTEVPELDAGAPLTRALAEGTLPGAGSGSEHALVKQTVALVPDDKPTGSVSERVLATLAEIEAQTGPRLEIALIRAQIGAAAAATDAAARADLTGELATRFPEALAARVATARTALASGDDRAIKSALEALAGERGALAWALRGRWQCSNCGNRPGQFSWRCGQCRRWGTLKMETGVEPPPVQARERREVTRTRLEGLLGTAPDASLPSATLDPGLSEDELREAGTRRSLLNRVGGWFSNRLRRNP